MGGLLGLVAKDCTGNKETAASGSESHQSQLSTWGAAEGVPSRQAACSPADTPRAAEGTGGFAACWGTRLAGKGGRFRALDPAVWQTQILAGLAASAGSLLARTAQSPCQSSYALRSQRKVAVKSSLCSMCICICVCITSLSALQLRAEQRNARPEHSKQATLQRRRRLCAATLHVKCEQGAGVARFGDPSGGRQPPKAGRAPVR